MLKWTADVGEEDDLRSYCSILLVRPETRGNRTSTCWQTTSASSPSTCQRMVTVPTLTSTSGVQSTTSATFSTRWEVHLVCHLMRGYVVIRAAAAYETRTDGLVLAGSAHN